MSETADPTREGESGEPLVIAEEEWQSVSKPTPRRLAPQHTLSKADLGADSPRNKAAVDTSKKKRAYFFWPPGALPRDEKKWGFGRSVCTLGFYSLSNLFPSSPIHPGQYMNSH